MTSVQLPSMNRGPARMRAATVSLVIAVVLLAAKLIAWRMTGSAAILSDALESIVNVVAAAMALFSVWYGSQPADAEHPYGHGKVEDFSAGVEGALIVLAALLILRASIPRFFDPHPLESLGAGGLLVGGATVANLLLGLYLVRAGRTHHSKALVADGHHVLADVVTSIGALGALILVGLTGWLWLDPAIACVIAVHIVVAGYRLIRDSVSRLMDEADAEALDRLAAQLEASRRDHWIDIHELRAWWSGDTLHVDAHLVLPRYWNLDRAHAVGQELEGEIAAAVPETAEAVVHVDPCADEFCSACRIVDCEIRGDQFSDAGPWDRGTIVRPVAEQE
jgi:cation diffusion facilitator family transporter